MITLAQGVAGYSIIQWIIIIIIVAAVIAVMYVVLNRMGVGIPDWLVKIFWIVVAAVVGIVAIKILWSML